MSFNTEKFYLWFLCKRDHEHEGSGKSLCYKSSGGCVECSRINTRKRYMGNKKRHLVYTRKWRIANPMKACGYCKTYFKTTQGRLVCILADMKKRCFNLKNKDYTRYGGRGITICQAWLNSLDAFREWALANGYVAGLVIDRIDNDGNYCPDNCQWLTKSDHAKKHAGKGLKKKRG